ncbi:2084_t:CDS:2, partial [Funneliformis caledonium]
QEVVKQSYQNSHKKKGVEKIAQVIIDGIQDDVKHQEPISSGCSLRELFHEIEISATAQRWNNSAEQDDFPTPKISAENLETSEKFLPEENSSLSADLEDYIKTLTGDFDDETAYWGTPYENKARVEKEE